MRKIVTIILLAFSVVAAGQDKSEGIFAVFNTNKGTFRVQLDYKRAPMTVANFIGLAEGTIKNKSYPPGVPFFNGSIWHRVVPGHVIQGGEPSIVKDPANNETSSTGYELPNEITGMSHNKAGMMGMANDGPNTNTCQYYITLGDRSYLDGNYTLFGEVFEGMDVVNRIVQGDTTFSVIIERKGDEADKFVVNDESFSKLVKTQWEKVNHEKVLKKEREEQFISDNYPGLISLPDGLRYKVLSQGKGNVVSAGDVLTLSYTGKLINGTVFFSTSDEGKPDQGIGAAPFSYAPGKTNLIPGLQESLRGMKAGEKKLVVIPPELGYGVNRGFYGKEIPGRKRFVISPGETLIVEVTLIKINK